MFFAALRQHGCCWRSCTSLQPASLDIQQQAHTLCCAQYASLTTLTTACVDRELLIPSCQ
jgi:hypothetical protein